MVSGTVPNKLCHWVEVIPASPSFGDTTRFYGLVSLYVMGSNIEHFLYESCFLLLVFSAV